MANKEFRPLKQAEIDRLADDFLTRITYPHSQPPGKKVLIVGGGANGAGKTTACRTISRFANAYHVQANSARFLLAKKGYDYGENVVEVIKRVVEELLAQGFPVVLDGMMTEESRRNLVRDLAQELGAKTFFFAVMCRPDIAEQRARLRYTDGKESSFDDWRAKDVEGYMTDVTVREALLREKLREVPDDPFTGVWRVNNSGDRGNLNGKTAELYNTIKHNI